MAAVFFFLFSGTPLFQSVFKQRKRIVNGWLIKLGSVNLGVGFVKTSTFKNNKGVRLYYCIPGGASANPGFIFMSLKKATLFIDGSNTYHRLIDNGLYDFFRYDWLYEELSKRYNIERVFLYDATKNFNIEPQQFSEQQIFHEKLKKQMPNLGIRTRKLKYLTKDDKIESAKNSGGFCASCIRKIETFLRNAGLRKLSKEKGVDVLLVTDMIKFAFQDKYDAALLLTGDADFIPAVELVQSLKREVINVHCYAGSSGELRDACDSHILITADAMNTCFLKYY